MLMLVRKRHHLAKKRPYLAKKRPCNFVLSLLWQGPGGLSQQVEGTGCAGSSQQAAVDIGAGKEGDSRREVGS